MEVPVLGKPPKPQYSIPKSGATGSSLTRYVLLAKLVPVCTLLTGGPPLTLPNTSGKLRLGQTAPRLHTLGL